MSNHNPLHDKARQLLLAELARAVPADLLLNGMGWRADHRPATWLLSDLVDLMAENHHRPAAELEPMVRRLVYENQFNDDSGDCPTEQHQAAIDFETNLVVRVLEDLRRQAIADGHWSTDPNAPIMFG